MGRDCISNPKNQKQKEEDPKQKEPLRKPTNGANGTNGRNCECKQTRNIELADDMQNEQHSEQCFTHCQNRNHSDSLDYEEYHYLSKLK
jgi:hypothetical protein